MKRLIAILIFTTWIPVVKGQEKIQDLLELKLPPIDTLFKGAMNSSMVRFYEYRMEGEELSLKTEKRRWLEYFSFAGTYQYGVMGMNSFMDLGDNYPIVYQYTGGEQLWYNVGASFRLPLDKLFDRRNKIRTQQLKIKETLKERDMWYDEQRVNIIELYFKAQEMLNNLKYVMEQYTLAEAQYDIAQKDYIMGNLTAQSLNVAKGAQVQTGVQLERVIAELKTSLMKLEILSNTKILNR